MFCLELKFLGHRTFSAKTMEVQVLKLGEKNKEVQDHSSRQTMMSWSLEEMARTDLKQI